MKKISKYPSNSKCRAALDYVKGGFRVVPIWGITDGYCDCGNSNCPSPGKHPISGLVPHGEKNASLDTEEVREWWHLYPNANIGILIDGVTVVDIDSREAWKQLAETDVLDETATVKTGRGFHYWYKGTVRAGRKIPKVDIKTNGYVIAPPSNHHSGAVYRWKKGLEHISPLPRELREFLAARDQSQKIDEDQAHLIIKKSGRNNALTSYAGYFRAKGYHENQIVDILDAINDVACHPRLGEEEVNQIARSVAKYPRSVDQYFACIDDVETRKITFLWEPYILHGSLTLIDGSPGVGKSYLTTAIATAATRNEFCGGGARVADSSVLFLSAEDDAEYILKPRLMALGADLSRIKFLAKHLLLDDAGIELLRQELEANPARLVIIDPLVAFLPSRVDMYRANEVRGFLMPLAELAKETGAAITVVRHLRKAAADQAIHSGMGSIDFIAAARSALVVASDPDDSDRKIVAHAKHNYSARGPSFAYRLVKSENDDHPKLKWDGVSNLTADQLLSSGPAVRKSSEADDFLRDLLAGGPLPGKVVLKLAYNRGISKRTLERAKNTLGVKSGKGPGAKWSLD